MCALEYVGVCICTKSEEDIWGLYHWLPYYFETGSVTVPEAHCLAIPAALRALAIHLSSAQSTGQAQAAMPGILQ